MNQTVKWTLNWAHLSSNIYFTFLKKTTSTNDFCKALNLQQNQPHWVLTEYQTHGRGRNKNKWIHSDFMGSLTWIQKEKIHPRFSIYVGEILLKSFQNTWPSLDWSFKQPNDIYRDQKKVAGVLIETFPIQDFHQVIVGLGINVLNRPHLHQANCIEFVNEKSWHKFLHHLNNQLMIQVHSR